MQRSYTVFVTLIAVLKVLQLRAQVAFVYYKFECEQTIMQSCDKPGN